MTMQCSDYVYYEGRKYTLIAIEKNTDLINSADFGLKNFSAMTSCYRGYTAEYFVSEDNFLYGVKTVESGSEITDSKIIMFFQESPKLKMNYTGSLLLARNRDDRFSGVGFIENYLNFDEAFEFYFIDGELVQITDLAEAIQEWNQIKNAPVPKQRRRSQRKHPHEVPESVCELWKKEKEIALKHLEFQYSNTYY